MALAVTIISPYALPQILACISVSPLTRAEINRAQTIIISRFILALRASDQKSRTVNSLSQLTEIRAPTIAGFVGEMGQLLDHELAGETHDDPRDGKVGAHRLSPTHLDPGSSSSIAEVMRTRV